MPIVLKKPTIKRRVPARVGEIIQEILNPPIDKSTESFNIRSQNLEPSSQVWIPSGTALFLNVYNSLASLSVRVTGSVLKTNGLIAPFQVSITPSTDRAISTVRINLEKGFLQGLIVENVGANPQRGQTWIQIGIQRGPGSTGEAKLILLSDYLVNGAGLAFPGSRILSPLEGPGMLKSITGTNPAAGAEITETVPAGAAWILKSLRYVLVADATVITRRTGLRYTDGSNTLFIFNSQQAQTAGQTITYSWLKDLPLRNSQSEVTDTSVYGIIYAGWKILTQTLSLQAGDDYGAPQYTVEEWINP